MKNLIEAYESDIYSEIVQLIEKTGIEKINVKKVIGHYSKLYKRIRSLTNKVDVVFSIIGLLILLPFLIILPFHKHELRQTLNRLLNIYSIIIVHGL